MSTVAENSFLNAFDLWWNTILLESEDFNQAFLSDKHCLRSETREINFDEIENRLIYMHTFGNFNIQFVEKCIKSFLDNCTEAEDLFLRENLKICSLSNGPGLDLIGLLIAIYKSSLHLKCFPILKLINLYNSWWNVCKKIFRSFYEVVNSSLEDKIKVPPEIIHLTQNDIYSSISHEAKECMMDSDILLMVKVFASPKATYDKAVNCMKEIFSLIKPGTFVFFIGSKKNSKELTENNTLNHFINIILGPTKISLEDLCVAEEFKCVAMKPLKSGSAYFIVWQKKDIEVRLSVSNEMKDDTDINSKRKRKRLRRKKKSKVNVEKKVTGSICVLNEVSDNMDTCSEKSLSSSSKKSEILSDNYKNILYQNIFQSESTVDMKTGDLEEKEQNLSQKDLLFLAPCNDLKKVPLKQVIDDTIVSNELKHDTDTNFKWFTSSKLSDDCTSYSKELSELKTASHAHMFRSYSAVEISKSNLIKRDLNLSLNDLPLAINNVTSCLDKIQIKPLNLKTENASKNIQNKKFKNHVTKEEIITQTKNQDDSFEEISARQIFELKMVSREVSQNLKSPIVNEISSCGEVNNKHVFPQMNQRQIILQKPTLPSKFKSTFLVDESRAKDSFKNKNTHSVQLPSVSLVNESIPNLKKNGKSGELDMPTVSLKDNTQTPSKSKKTYLTPINSVENKSFVVLKEGLSNEVSTTLSYNKDNINSASACKILDKGETIKKSKKNRKQSVIKESATLSDVTVKMEIGKNMHKLVVENPVHESLSQFKRSSSIGEKTSLERNSNKQDMNLLLLRCENLVASLENLTDSVKKNILCSHQNSRCCLNESCIKFKHSHACASSCCYVHSNCSRHMCNCQFYLKSSCPNCKTIQN